jgi:hypothetical protein
MGALISDKFTFHHPAFQFQHSDGSCLGEDKTHYQCLAFSRWSHDVVLPLLTSQLACIAGYHSEKTGKTEMA